MPPCLTCDGRYHIRIRCADDDKPALLCDAPQPRPHVHVACTRCLAEWVEPEDGGSQHGPVNGDTTP